MSPPTVESFLGDVALHEVTILHEDGLYRHIRFARPGTYCMHFDIVTWPGYLAYSGDMGDYVFSRVPDMLAFFRKDRPDGALNINLPYWSEKVQAQDKSDGLKEYSPQIFRDRIKELTEEWITERELDDTDAAEMRQEVEDEVISRGQDYETLAYQSAMVFEYCGKHVFTDFQEVNLREYTYRFIWCCYALVWGIQQYDAAKAGVAERASS